jgi:hypothetical protein
MIIIFQHNNQPWQSLVSLLSFVDDGEKLMAKFYSPPPSAMTTMATDNNGDGRMTTMVTDDDGRNDGVQFYSPPPP